MPTPTSSHPTATPLTPPPDDDGVQDALNRIVRDSLRPVSIGLGFLYLFFAVSHYFFLPPPIQGTMMTVAGSTALLLFGLAVYASRREIPPRWAHPLATGIAGLALVNSLLHQYLLPEPRLSTNIALLIVGVGVFFLSVRWLWGVLLVTLAGWTAIALTAPPSPDWLHFAFLQVGVTVIAVLAHNIRLRTFARLERLHRQERRQKAALAEAVEATRQSEERFRRLAEATFEGIVIHDMGIILDVNEAAAHMFGFEPEEVIGMNALELAPPESRETILRHILSGSDEPYEVLGVKKDGSTFPIEMNGKFIPYQGRQVRVTAIRDISRRKQVEEALRQAKEAAEAADRAKTTFLANMSHELRTPLTVMIGYSEVLQEDAAELGHEDLVPHLERIQIAGNHLLDVINDILMMTKIEAGKVETYPEKFLVSELVDNLVSMTEPLVQRNGNRLAVEMNNAPRHLYTDRTKLRQILMNLVSNAAKFTENGTITLQVEGETTPSGEAASSASHVIFRVIDTGIGISEEFLQDLFQPFHQIDPSSTRKYEGSGLGLAISRSFAHLMGGDITVHSQPGHGSTFTLRLPCHMPQPEADSDSVKPAIASP